MEQTEVRKNRRKEREKKGFDERVFVFLSLSMLVVVEQNEKREGKKFDGKTCIIYKTVVMRNKKFII